MNNSDIQTLVSEIMRQAVKDYCTEETDEGKAKILVELRSKWMVAITDGASTIVADQLEKNCADITARLKKYREIGRDNQ